MTDWEYMSVQSIDVESLLGTTCQQMIDCTPQKSRRSRLNPLSNDIALVYIMD